MCSAPWAIYLGRPWSWTSTARADLSFSAPRSPIQAARITFSASMSQSKSERFKDTQKRHSKKLGGSMPTLYKSAVHPTSAWREKPPSQACPSVPWARFQQWLIPSNDEESLEEHREEWVAAGGGDTVNSGRAHIYLSDKRYGADGYRSGLRGKCPVEIKSALGQAVEGGIIFSRTAMDGIWWYHYVWKDTIPVYHQHHPGGQNALEPRREQSRAQHLGEAGEAKHPDSWCATDPKRWQGFGVRRWSRWCRHGATRCSWRYAGGWWQCSWWQTGACRPATHEGAPCLHHSEKCRATFTGDCPLRMVEYVSGQITCATCGYEPLSVDESGQVKHQANRRTKVLEKRISQERNVWQNQHRY